MTIIELPPPPLPMILPTLVALADCVCELVASEGAGETCWCGMYAGTSVSWEYCGDCGNGKCGMAWVRPVGIFPSDQFPLPVVDLRCTYPLVWQVEIGVLRCMPTPADGRLIEPVEMAEITVEQGADAMALYRAAKCCEATAKGVLNWVPLGPQGGCVGGAWTMYLAVDD